MTATRTDRQPDAHGIAVGDRVRGRCVTMGSDYTGTVAEVVLPPKYSGQSGNRYKLVDTDQHYAGGREIEPIVECAERIGCKGCGEPLVASTLPERMRSAGRCDTCSLFDRL